MRLNPRLARATGADRSLSSVATRAITSATSSAGAASDQRGSTHLPVERLRRCKETFVGRQVMPERDTVHALPRANAAAARDGAREAMPKRLNATAMISAGRVPVARARWRGRTPGAPGRPRRGTFYAGAWSPRPRAAGGSASHLAQPACRRLHAAQQLRQAVLRALGRRVRLRPSVEISTCCPARSPIWRSIWRGSVTETEPPMARRGDVCMMGAGASSRCGDVRQCYTKVSRQQGRKICISRRRRERSASHRGARTLLPSKTVREHGRCRFGKERIVTPRIPVHTAFDLRRHSSLSRVCSACDGSNNLDRIRSASGRTPVRYVFCSGTTCLVLLPDSSTWKRAKDASTRLPGVRFAVPDGALSCRTTSSVGVSATASFRRSWAPSEALRFAFGRSPLKLCSNCRRAAPFLALDADNVPAWP